MIKTVVACSVAALFALSVPAEALFGGGGGGRSGGGSKSSGSKSSSSRGGGGVSVGGSIGRGGASVGASVGGARAGASVGRGGVSAGASVGGAGVGASVGGGGASVSASGGSLSAGASVSGGGVDASVSAGSLAISGSIEAGGDASAGVPGAVSAAAGAPLLLIALPEELLPRRRGDSEPRCESPLGDCAGDKLVTGRAAAADPAPEERLLSEPGTPIPVVTACQRAAAHAARKYGARRVEAAGSGSMRELRSGGLVAPVILRITYGEGAKAQIRQAEVSCSMNARGQVTAIT